MVQVEDIVKHIVEIKYEGSKIKGHSTPVKTCPLLNAPQFA
jgi:hypothetical protein